MQVGTVEQYLEKGPGFIFLFHPALGPMWDVIAQKIRGGALMHGSELVLEVRSWASAWRRADWVVSSLITTKTAQACTA